MAIEEREPGRDPNTAIRAAARPRVDDGHGRPPADASAGLQATRHRRESPEPFFPDFLFKEAIVALAAFIILVLVVIYFRVPLEPVADPTSSTYVPRPEWYFLFVFELLKHVPGSQEPIATTVLPVGFGALLILLPFIDRGPARGARRRPLATTAAVVLLSGAALLTVQAIRTTPHTGGEQAAVGPKLDPTQEAGRLLYQQMKCDACHKIGAEGGATGPELTHVGTRRDAKWIHTFLENPSAIVPKSPMPGYLDKLSHNEIEQMAQYLAALK